MTEESTPLIVADASKGIKVNAGVIAKPFRDEIKVKVQSMVKQGIGTSVQCRLTRRLSYSALARLG
jgi:hypothetical protein